MRVSADESPAHDYDLLVIGSGPGGQKAAIAAAKLGKRVAIADRGHMMGGVCVNTGTIPSKTLREAVLYLSGFSQREMYGASYRVKSEITVDDLLWRDGGLPRRHRPELPDAVGGVQGRRVGRDEQDPCAGVGPELLTQV